MYGYVMLCYLIPNSFNEFHFLNEQTVCNILHRQPPNLGIQIPRHLLHMFQWLVYFYWHRLALWGLWGSQDCAPGHLWVPQGMQWFSRNEIVLLRWAHDDRSEHFFLCAWGILWDLPWSDLILSQLASLVIHHHSAHSAFKLESTRCQQWHRPNYERLPLAAVTALWNWRELSIVRSLVDSFLVLCYGFDQLIALDDWFFRFFASKFPVPWALGEPMVGQWYSPKFPKIVQNIQGKKKGTPRAGPANKPQQNIWDRFPKWNLNLRGPASNREESHEVLVKIGQT